MFLEVIVKDTVRLELEAPPLEFSFNRLCGLVSLEIGVDQVVAGSEVDRSDAFFPVNSEIIKRRVRPIKETRCKERLETLVLGQDNQRQSATGQIPLA